MIISVLSFSISIYFSITSAGGLNFRPATFLGCVETGTSSVTTLSKRSSPVYFPDGKRFYHLQSFNICTKHGNPASEILLLRTSVPKSNSWLPSAIASNRITFISSMTDSPRNIFAQLAPCIMSRLPEEALVFLYAVFLPRQQEMTRRRAFHATRMVYRFGKPVKVIDIHYADNRLSGLCCVCEKKKENCRKYKQKTSFHLNSRATVV